MKKLVLLLILLSVFSVNGQNAIQINDSLDSLTISLRTARLIEQDLIEKDYLLIEVNLQKSEIKLLEERLGLSAKKEQNLQLQFSLAQKKAENFKILWEAEKLKRNPGYSFKAFLNDVQLVGLGVIMGVLAVVL